MIPPSDDPAAELRRRVYVLLIFLGAGVMLGRILAVDAVDRAAVKDYRLKKELAIKGQVLRSKGLEAERYQGALRREKERLRRLLPPRRRPFLSANDRSRWCTVRALVEKDKRVEGAPYAIDRVIEEPGWDTIDMVQHDGHLYSSKPPLFPTLLAGAYWVVHHFTGMSLGSHPYLIGRLMLIITNLAPLVIYFLLLARLVERLGTTNWGRIFVVAAAVFGTFLTTFAVVINNHLPAAVSAMVALYAAVRIWFDPPSGDGERRWRYFVVAGVFAAFTAANELPALSLFVVLSGVLFCKAPRRTALAYVPAALIVAAGFFATNWIAHQSLRPPYLHRSESDKADNWYDYTYVLGGVEYESYWNNPVGIDRGEPSLLVYATHILVGHHGIFSLTPVWLMAAAGMVMWLWGGARGEGRGAREFPSSESRVPSPEARGLNPQSPIPNPHGDRRLRELAMAVGAVSLVVLVFYLARPVHHRNYGGMTSGLRWVFWLAPLWLVVMLPAADAMARRGWTRLIALMLLAASILSASYPTWNPWTNPWIWDYMYRRWL